MRTDVLIIGGGATGAGIARDMSMRGASVMLLERADFSGGASGGNHGLLHSGARYAVRDPESARECAEECEVLRHIAWHCIEDLGGLFVRLASDDPSYVDQFVQGCRDTGVSTEAMTRREVLEAEPALSTEIAEGFQVRDASIDPFQLVLSNVQMARANGALVRNHSPVVKMTREGGRVTEVRYRDRRNGEEMTVRPELVVNVSGAWSGEVARMAGCDVNVSMDSGTLLVMSGRLVNTLINRLRPPSDGDIVVPNRTSMVLGTTSQRIADPWSFTATATDIDHLLQETSKMVPGIDQCRAIRAYASVRPLVGDEGEGRKASRSYQIYDHSNEGVDNFFSIIGGKLTTYRAIAEHISDILAAELGLSERCRTQYEPLVEKGGSTTDLGLLSLPLAQLHRRYGRIPKAMMERARTEPEERRVVCTCEQVCRFELEHFASQEDVLDLSDLLRRTRAGMGYCQGTACSFEMLSALVTKHRDPRGIMERFLCDRYKGIAPALRGDQLRQELFRSYLLKGVYGLETGRGSCR